MNDMLHIYYVIDKILLNVCKIKPKTMLLRPNNSVDKV